MRKTILLSLTFLSVAALSNDNSQKNAQNFIENKGQIHDQNFKANSDVKYLLNLPGMNVQLKSNSFSYDTYVRERKEIKSPNKLLRGKENDVQYNYKYHRIDIEFVNANPNAQLIAEGRSTEYLNFYNSVTDENGATEVHHYNKVTYKNIYPNIDVEFVAEQKTNNPVEYNFILKPGANINNIQLKYKGANTIELKNGKLNINVSNGNLVEEIPVSFWKNSGKKEKINYEIINCNGSEAIIGYNGFSKPITETLIIDPTPFLSWGTYFGGLSSATGIASDPAGFIYHVGNALVNTIATTGAYQTSVNGGGDAYLAKFDKNGGLIWATYYGGPGGEDATGVSCDKYGRIYFSGSTNSSSGIASSSSHQTGLNGTVDAFLAKFTNVGTRMWCTYYGGSEMTDERGFSVCNDKFGNVFLAGITDSPNSIATSSGFQTSLSNGIGTAMDDFLVKFDSLGVRQWGTYYGNNGYEWDGRAVCDLIGNVFLAGETDSPNNIATSGANQTTINGANDAFIVKFTNAGSRLWATYYGGPGGEIVGDIKADLTGNVIITGNTSGGTGITTTGCFQSTYGGGFQDGFIAKFNPNGIIKWGTYYGGFDKEWPSSLSIDTLNAVYVGGWTSSPNAMATAGSHQNTWAGSGDCFLAKFDSTGNRQWGTYYGGVDEDRIQGVYVDKSLSVFVAGFAVSATGIATPGAFLTTANGGDSYSILAKFLPTGSIGIEEFNNKTNEDLIIIYPNPNNGEFFIKTKEEMTVEIVNELGQIIKTISLNLNNNYNEKVNDLSSGFYFISRCNVRNYGRQKVIVGE
jgi:hypothetical protein